MQLIDRGGCNIMLDGDSILFYRQEEKKYIRYSLFAMDDIDEGYYLQVKFGKAYKKVSSRFGDKKIKDANSAILPDGSVLVSFYQDSVIHKYDLQGELLWKNEDAGKWDTIYDIAVEDNFVWCAYPTSNTIKRFSLDTFREDVSLGGWEEKIFNYPETINVYSDSLFVCDMGSKRIIKVKLSSHKIEEHMHFNEPVWEYVQLKDKEIVRLDSGIYLL